MLDITVLDDKSYSALMEEALDSIPRLAPDWTDYNAHDPGITFLELFAWLTEMQRYYIQQTTKRHTLAYLRLLGITPLPATPALLIADINISGGDMTLNAGARADIGGIPYTLPEDAFLNGALVLVCMEPDGESSPPYGLLPFGETPREGDIFYLHLSSALTPEKTYKLYVRTSTREGRVPMEDGYFTQADILAEVWNGFRWCACDMTDGTYGLSQSGFLTVRIPECFLPFSGRQLIRVTLVRCDIEEPPMLLRLSMCAVTLAQQERVYDEDTEIAVADDKTVPLPLEGRGVSRIAMETEEHGRRYSWHQIHDIYCAKTGERRFELDEDNSCLRFGESPPDRVWLRELYVTMGLEGRVKENLRFWITDGTGKYEAYNELSSEGGYNRDTVADALRRDMASRVRRAVTRDDYISIIAGTPGLWSKSVEVFEPEPGKVRVCVKTHSGRLTESVKRNIRKRLGMARLCCSEVEILEPEYWRARLFVGLRLNKWAYGKTEAVRGRIEEIVSPFEDKFGLLITLSEWRSMILKIPHVNQVTELFLQGMDGRQTGPGETLKLPPDSLLCISELVLDIC